jgi:NADH-quinone oxidoreductase subunit K
MHPVIPYVTAAMLFGAGVYGVVRRRNAVLVLMAVELMLNAVNLILVTADVTLRGAVTGQVFTLFIIVIAAAEVGVGLAIVLQLYRLRASAALDTVALSAGDDDTAQHHDDDAAQDHGDGAEQHHGEAVAQPAEAGR